MSLVELDGVDKGYFSSGEATEVLKGLELRAVKEEMLVIMGLFFTVAAVVVPIRHAGKVDVERVIRERTFG